METMNSYLVTCTGDESLLACRMCDKVIISSTYTEGDGFGEERPLRLPAKS